MEICNATVFCKNSVKLIFSLKSYTENQFCSGGKFLKLPHCGKKNSIVFSIGPKISWQKFGESCSCTILLNSWFHHGIFFRRVVSDCNTTNSFLPKYNVISSNPIMSEFFHGMVFNSSFAKHRRTYRLMRKISRGYHGELFQSIFDSIDDFLFLCRSVNVAISVLLWVQYFPIFKFNFKKAWKWISCKMLNKWKITVQFQRTSSQDH